MEVVGVQERREKVLRAAFLLSLRSILMLVGRSFALFVSLTILVKSGAMWDLNKIFDSFFFGTE